MQKNNLTIAANYHRQETKIQILAGRSILVILILLVGDLVSFSLAFALATGIRSAAIAWIGGVLRWNAFIHLLQLNLVIILIAYLLMGLYPGFGLTAVEEMRLIFNALTLGYGVLSLAVYFQRAGLEFPRSVFVMGWIFACLFNTTIRFVIRNRASLYKWWGMPVVVIGPGVQSDEVIEKLLHSRRMGLRPVLVLDEAASVESRDIRDVPIIRSQDLLQDLIAKYRIHYAILVESPQDTRQEVRNQLNWLSRFFPTVLVALADSPLGSLWVRTMDLEGRLTLKAQYHLLDPRSVFIKRIFDIILSSIVAVLTLPLLLLIALLIKVESHGPVFYAQERLGLRGKKFRYLKFRTMVVDAETRLSELLQEDSKASQEYQKHHKLANDPRITRVGRFLRKFSLDELPQLWHVLNGEMSLVGPRAYLISEFHDMGDSANLILQIRPGVTGWWQVMGRHNTTFQHRLQLDEYYLSNWSLWLDIYIVMKTGWVVFSGQGT